MHGVARSAAERKSFVLQTPVRLVSPSKDLRDEASTLLKGHMTETRFTMVDCVTMRPKQLQSKSGTTTVYRYFITVGSLCEAADIVHDRCQLKGTQYTLLDVLTVVEQAAHDLLWPRFIEARAQPGHKAQFNRARLFVDGKEVLPAAPR
jgi:predicted kinase